MGGILEVAAGNGKKLAKRYPVIVLA